MPSESTNTIRRKARSRWYRAPHSALVRIQRKNKKSEGRAKPNRPTVSWRSAPWRWANYYVEWIAYALSQMPIFTILDYCAKFGILVSACIFIYDFFVERPTRETQELFAGATSGAGDLRIDSLEQLNEERKALYGLQLQDAYLPGIQLNNAKLARANLTGAFLIDANLSEADLTEANLREAVLDMADLTGAELAGVDLKEADLFGAKLTRADFSRPDWWTEHDAADLTGANICTADLREAKLSGVNLSHADLGSADLTGANLRGQDLSGANLGGANLCEVDLSYADLSGADLYLADLSGAELCGTDLSGADLTTRGNLTEIQLRSAKIDKDTIVRSELEAVKTEMLAAQGSEPQDRKATVAPKEGNGDN